MQCVASIMTRVPAALLQQVQQRVANTNQLALHATFTTAAAVAQLHRFGLCCLAPCGLQAPVLQLSAAQLYSSSSLNDSAPQDMQQTNDASVKDSRGSSAYHVNLISLDQLLESSPIAANASSSNPAYQLQQQQQLTEQMLSQLFDAELEQRLLSAAVVARASTNITAGPVALQDSAAGNTEQQQQHHTYLPHQNQASKQQQQQQQQRMHQPGVVPMQQQQSSADRAGSSSNSTGTARVARWTPLDKADPWAPIPGPAFTRRRLPSQLQQLLEQAGVPPGTAAAAIAQAAADFPRNTAAAAGQADASSRSSRVPQQPTRPHSDRIQQLELRQQQQQQRQQGPVHESYTAVLNRLQHKQLVSLLEDCQAPTYGDKQLLLRRLVLLLQDQQAAAALADTPMLEPLPQGLGGGVGFWAEGEQGFGSQPHHGTVDAGVDAVGNCDSSGAVTAKSEADKVVNHHQQQQQQRGSPLSQQVQAAAAARQQLLAAVLDAGQVGRWLMAARAQDVCIVDVSGRAGLHKQLVVATGLSQRHAHACAEAIAWQLREKAKEHLAQQQQQQQQEALAGQQEQEFPASQLPSLSVLGDASSDWAVLDAGAVVVHVLTDRARRFYNLEGLWGGPQGRFISWLTPEQVVETKDTIGRDAAGGSA